MKILNNFGNLVKIFFAIGLILFSSRILYFGIISFLERDKLQKSLDNTGYMVFGSILVILLLVGVFFLINIFRKK